MANQIDPRIERVLISAQEIEAATTDAAKWINTNYENKQPVMVAILKGSIPFFAKVLSKVTVDVQTDFVVYRSYAGNVASVSEPELVADLKNDIHRRHVIVVEDICDSGKTMEAFVNLLKKRHPASVKLMVLCNKQAHRTTGIKPDYICFNIPDEFIAGFGLDYQEYMRNLPYIGVFNKELFDKELAKLNRSK